MLDISFLGNCITFNVCEGDDCGTVIQTDLTTDLTDKRETELQTLRAEDIELKKQLNASYMDFDRGCFQDNDEKVGDLNTFFLLLL